MMRFAGDVNRHALVNQRGEEALLHLEGAGRDRANRARPQPLRLHRLVARGGEGNFVLTGLFARSPACRFHLRFLLFGQMPVAFQLHSVAPAAFLPPT